MKTDVFVRIQDVLTEHGVVGVVIPQWNNLRIAWVSREIFSEPMSGLAPGMTFVGRANLQAQRDEQLDLSDLTRASAPDPAYSPAYALWEAQCRGLKSMNMSGL